MRQESCRLNSITQTIEAGWRLEDAYRTSCRDIYGGSLGGPLFEDGSDMILALASTTTTGGRYPCSFGAPCEISGGVEAYTPDATYATPVHGLEACFDTAGQFDLALPACPLPAERQVEIASFSQSYVQPAALDALGEGQASRWGVTLAGDFPYYRYKAGPVEQVDCHTDVDYSIPFELAFDNSINQKFGAEDGWEQLCIIGGDSADGQGYWQPAAEAAILLARVDSQPPAVEPIVEFLADSGFFNVHIIYDPPELMAYQYQIGPSEQINCEETGPYQPYGSEAIKLPAQEFPLKLCVMAYDAASNPSGPYQYIFGEKENLGQ